MNHRRKKLLGFAVLFVLLVSLIGCGKSTDDQTKKQEPKDINQNGNEIQHAMGTTALAENPEKVVVLEFSYVDALMTLDVQPIGIADDDNPALFMDTVKEQLGDYTSIGSRYEPNIELLSSLQPDLIIADLNHHKAIYDQLKKIAPTIVLDDHQADYSQMLDNYLVIAKAVGKEEEGKKRLQQHNEKIDALKAGLANAEMTILPAVTNPEGFFAHSDHSYVGSFLTSLGFDDPVKSEDSYPKLSLEQLVETNPEAIFLMPATEETIVDVWSENPLWQEIEAVKNNKVFTVERRDWALSRGLIGSEKIIDDLSNQLGVN
ncbi:Fe(3+) dicitrate ABC transporter substrate-binding protein [Sporosarcina saromensis]|uniref:Fe(3+) dicitrate ABC transporter substrate-binding protein n=1 Tax=Sporosarcina saromensis TaxID=359365 RepID=A0ABU4G9M6_9BACL|nr:Fe(3+) dicitrate ABC transporter substrate-binding protein [Sporosarcina saromensis]MDW0113679.1 Fe(3+) dicitrate ABC transporter substrate-binding protein [Sporosarcina saromensis]